VSQRHGRGSGHLAQHSIAVLAAVALLAPVTDSGPPDSGIRANVVYGPTCPVERPGERCERPYDATLRIRARSTHRIVRTVRSGRDGRFKVRLRPGRYVVEPVEGERYPRADPVPATVRAHRFTRVTVSFDSGIR
jgi:hypothetical protein